MKPSAYQRAILEYIRDGRGNLMVQALAGSGKTSTLIAATKYVDGKRCLFLAFNKGIADTIKNRLPLHFETRTFNAFGLKLWKGDRGRMATIDAEKTDTLMDEHGGPIVRSYRYILRRLISLAKMNLIAPSGFGKFENDSFFLDMLMKDAQIYSSICRIADKNLMRPEQFIQTRGGDISSVAERVLVRSVEVCDKIIDFDDQIYLPIIHEIICKPYDYVLVDELQDCSEANLRLIQIACGPQTKVIGIGDFLQCQPQGTMISLEGGGQVDIKDIKVGQKVVSFRRDKVYFAGSSSAGRAVTAKAVREYSGIMYKVSADGNSTECTYNHKWIARYNIDKHTNDLHVVYLMRDHEKPTRFRVGWCKLFSNGAVHLFHRARMEYADVWALKIVKGKQEASRMESVISAMYGLPTVMFRPRHNNFLYTQEVLNSIFEELGDLSARASKCLLAHKRHIEYPLYEHVPNSPWKRFTVFEIHACNLMSEIMSVPIYSGTRYVKWGSISISTRNAVKEKVYSLNVETNHTYIANNISTCNCIYLWRGVKENAMGEFKRVFNCAELPLNICYRCPQVVIKEAKKYNPLIEGWEEKGEGAMSWIEGPDFKDGDLILSRFNASLLSLACELIGKGKKFRFESKDIKGQILGLVQHFNARSVGELKQAVEIWYHKQKTIFEEKQQPDMLALLEDQYQCISTVYGLLAPSDDMFCFGEILDRVFGVGSGPRLCTIHGAKGLEADTVYILDYDKLPYQRIEGIIPQEEINLTYVAVTRAKNSLFFIKSADHLREKLYRRWTK